MKTISAIRDLGLALISRLPVPATNGLTFPNRSRSLDDSGRWVLFSGHDGMMQIRFRIEVEAISDIRGIADPLAGFDVSRAVIEEAARAAYGSGRKDLYLLTRATFR